MVKVEEAMNENYMSYLKKKKKKQSMLYSSRFVFDVHY